MLQYRMGEASCKQRYSNMAAEPEKLGVTDHLSHAETGGGAEGEKKPTKLSDFNLRWWVSVLCCRDCSCMCQYRL